MLFGENACGLDYRLHSLNFAGLCTRQAMDLAMIPDSVQALHDLAAAFEGEGLAWSGDTNADIDAMLAGFRLQKIRRYFHQMFWEHESELANKADFIEPELKLENVAAHSWHVADTVLLLAGRFPSVRADHAVQLAILHDKLEILTGDFDPVGAFGTGNDTHAFDAAARARKASLERAAMAEYLRSLRPSLREAQAKLLEENLLGRTSDARFVKSVDKLQALAFVYEKKQGQVSDEHLLFSLRYSLRAVEVFPEISSHYFCLAGRFISQVASYRGQTTQSLLAAICRSSGWDLR